jgi:hypothetical protein
MTVLTELAAYLETEGHGVVGTSIFIGRMPEAPNTAVALYEYTGLPGTYAHDEATPMVEYPNVQVNVRAADYATGRNLIEAIYTSMHLSNTDLSGTRYLLVRPYQAPYYLRRDANERAEFGFNVRVSKYVSV